VASILWATQNFLPVSTQELREIITQNNSKTRTSPISKQATPGHVTSREHTSARNRIFPRTAFKKWHGTAHAEHASAQILNYNRTNKKMYATVPSLAPVEIRVQAFSGTRLFQVITWQVQYTDEFRVKVSRLRFSLQFTQRKQEAAKSLPAVKPWQYLSIRLSCYRHHSQLSKSSVLNLSCDQFNQSCLAECKITPGVSISNNDITMTMCSFIIVTSVINYILFMWSTYWRKKCTVMSFSCGLTNPNMSVSASVIGNDKWKTSVSAQKTYRSSSSENHEWNPWKLLCLLCEADRAHSHHRVNKFSQNIITISTTAEFELLAVGIVARRKLDWKRSRIPDEDRRRHRWLTLALSTLQHKSYLFSSEISQQQHLSATRTIMNQYSPSPDYNYLGM